MGVVASPVSHHEERVNLVWVERLKGRVDTIVVLHSYTRTQLAARRGIEGGNGVEETASV